MERDLLVRKVFPELRRRCRERQVELVDVDLRWGITEAEAEQGKVLPICLAEIDRARPFFMGLLGERYGWVPAAGQFDRSLLIEQPWLEEHAGGKSVTELEILHGVLNSPQMAGRAFFYFRDPAWSATQGADYTTGSEAEREKLADLKDRIRTSGFPVVEDYADPATLAERVREDLWNLIDAAYPEADVPDPLTLERRRHEAYAASRRRLYLGGERYFEALDAELAAKSPRPVLVRGKSGGGKSALVANWLARWSQAHPDTAVIVHHLGCGADTADPVRMAVRIMQEIAQLVGEEFKPKSDPDEQLDELATWLATASAWAGRTGRTVLIVLDGLDKLANRQHLRWFPTVLPPGVRLVSSCLDGELLQAVGPRLPWRELVVEPFTLAEQTQFIGQYLGRFRKQLTDEQTRLLQSHPLVGNPLFLLTVLEELRVFGVHEELDQRLATLLSPPPSKQTDEVKAAKLLAKHDGDLILDGLSSISPSVAEALALHKGELHLNGLTSLSAEAARALAEHQGQQLSLDGLTMLSTEAADALAKHRGYLNLNGLKTLSANVSEALSRHRGSLYLGGLSAISDEAAGALAKGREPRQSIAALHLNGLTSLSAEAAEALANIQGQLSLNGLTSLSAEAAETLAEHQGELILDGLTTLSDNAAEALAEHQGQLSLDGLTTLSGNAAEALARHRGKTSAPDCEQLSLGGLTTLSDKAAEALAKHHGQLSLDGLTTLSDKAAEALAKHQGQLSLDGLTTLSDKAADALAGYKGVILSLRGLESLEYAAAAALAKSGAWDGCLPTVRTLADAAVEALATRHFGVLDLGGLETLSTTAAITLSQTTAELRLLGLKKISNKAAKALVSRMHTTEISTTLWKSLSASNQNIGEAKPHLQVRRPGYVRGFT